MKPARRTVLIAIAASAASVSSHAAGAGMDEEALARNVEAFRAAQVASDAAALRGLCAPELSYSHSDGRIEDLPTFVANATSGKSRFLSIEYRQPTVRVVGDAGVVRFHWVGDQQLVADGSRTATSLQILMVWQRRGGEWKLLARAATKVPAA